MNFLVHLTFCSPGHIAQKNIDLQKRASSNLRRQCTPPCISAMEWWKRVCVFPELMVQADRTNRMLPAALEK